jgi:dTDP-glucose 4,6-dehydratase
VLNLASPASPKDYAKYPIDTLRTGALGTDCVLRLAKRKGAVFLLASTSEVYGDPEHHPQSEWYWGHVNPIGPRSCYDEAKRYAEALTVAFAQAHDVQVRIARIFNTYGPRMRPEDGRVVSTFCCQALRGEPLTVYGDGSQTRSLCYVDDLVEGLLSLAFSQERGPVNLGNPEEVTVLRLAEEVREAAGGRSEIVFRPLPENDPKRRRPDITLARKVLGWEPRVSRSEGLRRTLGYFDDLLSGHLPGSPEATSKSGGS